MAINDPISQDRSAFDSAIQALKVEVANVGSHLSLDASARLAYTRQILAMSNELQFEVMSGRLTWAQAAQQAQEARNTIMQIIRGRSTPVGLAIAQSLKKEGVTLNQLVAAKTIKLHGPTARFDNLTLSQQNAVYGEIVKSAGRSNPQVTQTISRLSRAGRGLIVISIALSAYNIATADDKVSATGREVAVTGAGIGGGIAGGALAGLACGPGAPVCVTVGAFVGGALAAFGIDMLW
ncbi:hypothetical protein [Bordetella genomosp. 13]|uniref:hypothetical protein n=1 Tax=Bordetella genomosp. 13 TaxID=463040 RepID=UPI0011A55729|nr:hypothetical protein [Bordetella genomosp. 13]